MNGNYYYFAPLLDEKGEQVVRQIYAGDWAENEIGELVAYHDISINMGKKYPILTMKKFDHDPLLELQQELDKRMDEISVLKEKIDELCQRLGYIHT